MRHGISLRPELAAICSFVSTGRTGRNVRRPSRSTPIEPPARGILAELAALKRSV